ncbi:MAG: PIG-L family deacetylase [Bacteroidales bacterium]|nr:PIG-L family deacetylase [Candidatus Sodaliphilus fimicaballi]
MKKIALFIALCLVAANVAVAQDLLAGNYKKALIIGAHPDDPESMAYGTALRLRDMGCEVVTVYLTRGEAGIPGKTHEEAAAIRTRECEKVTEMTGIRHIFLNQIDGSSEITNERYLEMKQLIEAEKPDLVITHWPIDSHRDHRHAGLLTYDAWRRTGRHFDLFYAEVMTGLQTTNFNPTHYVDITSTRQAKLDAYLVHDSQGLTGNVAKFHDTMEGMRGLEWQCKWAEAFIKAIWPKVD